MVLSYAVSSADYRLVLAPLTANDFVRAQILIRQSARAAIGAPSWFPGRLLTVPLTRGGLGFPALDLRLRLRRMLHMVDAASCRSVYTRELVRGLALSPLWRNFPWSDGAVFQTDLALFGLSLEIYPFENVPQIALQGSWCRTPTDLPVVIVSDGSCGPEGVGFSAVFFDEAGLLGEFFGGVLLEDPSSWVAEWLAKVVGLHSLLPFPITTALLLADNTSVATLGGPSSSTGSHIVDCCIRFLLHFSAHHHLQEGFTPAAHDTGLLSFVANFQDRADFLAKEGLQQACVSSLPCIDSLAPMALLLRSGRICVKPARVLNGIYVENASITALSSKRPTSAWERVVSRALTTTEGISAMLWLRSADFFHHLPPAAYCPFCKLPLNEVIGHFQSECPLVPLCSAFAFRVALDTLTSIGWSIVWNSPWSATLSKGNHLTPVSLTVDGSAYAEETALSFSWSGLVLPPLTPLPLFTVEQCAGLSSKYISAFVSFLHNPRRLESLSILDNAFDDIRVSEKLLLGIVASITNACVPYSHSLQPPWTSTPKSTLLLPRAAPQPAEPFLPTIFYSHRTESSPCAPRLLFGRVWNLTWDDGSSPPLHRVQQAATLL